MNVKSADSGAEDVERWRQVGATIRAALKAQGLTQTDVGERVGIRQTVVSDDFRGPVRGIPRTRLIAYARLLEELTSVDHYDEWLGIAYGRE